MKTELRAFCSAFTQTGKSTFTVSAKPVIIVCAAWLAATAYVAQEHLPKNVISLPGQTKAKRTVTNLAPQGWAFFTKSPREAELVPYKKTEGGWKNHTLTPHASPHNAFGLNRRSRAQGVEIALLLSAAEKSDWRQCATSSQKCLNAYGAPARRIENRSPEPILCGTIGLLEEKPTPWAWRDLLPEPHSPERVMVLEVTC